MEKSMEAFTDAVCIHDRVLVIFCYILNWIKLSNNAYKILFALVSLTFDITCEQEKTFSMSKYVPVIGC